MNSYVILIKYDHEGAYLDSCLDVTAVARHGSMEKAILVEKVRQKFGASPDEELHMLGHNFRSLELRSRFDGACEGPFAIHSPEPLTRDQIDALLKDERILKRIRARQG